MKNNEMDIEEITKKLEQEGCHVLTEDELRLKVNGGWGRSSSSSSSSSSGRSSSSSSSSSSSLSSGGSSSSRSSSSGRSSSRSSGGGNSSKRNSGSTETTKTKTSFGQKVSNAISSIKTWAQSHAPTNRMDKGYGSSSKKDNDTAGTSQQHASTSDTSRSREVENTNHAVANARPGDTITRNNGTRITLKQSDIDYAKAHDTTPATTSSTATKIANSPSVASNPAHSKLNKVFIQNKIKSVLNKEATKRLLNFTSTWGGNSKTRSRNSTPISCNAPIQQVVKTSPVPAESPAPPTPIPLKNTKIDQTITPINNNDEIAKAIAAIGERSYDLSTGYRCDNWVENVLETAGKDPLNYFSGSSYSKTVPSETGYYVVFMDHGHIGKNGKPYAPHAGLLSIDGSGTMTLWDNSLSNENTGGVDKTVVTAPSLTRIKEFGYDSFYFQKIE